MLATAAYLELVGEFKVFPRKHTRLYQTLRRNVVCFASFAKLKLVALLALWWALTLVSGTAID